MRTLFLLGIAIITFPSGNSLITSKYNQYKTLKTTILVIDADWENLNLMIERSPIDKVKENFELFVKKNELQTTALNCKNGKYFG